MYVCTYMMLWLILILCDNLLTLSHIFQIYSDLVSLSQGAAQKLWHLAVRDARHLPPQQEPPGEATDFMVISW